MTDFLAASIIALVGLYFIGLGLASLLFPAQASRFLLGFARSPGVHYLELLLRLAVGASLIVHAPRMSYVAIFGAFGWILVLTTTALLLTPWRWHRRFAEQAVPKAIRHIALIGFGSLALGAAFLAALARGNVV